MTEGRGGKCRVAIGTRPLAAGRSLGRFDMLSPDGTGNEYKNDGLATSDFMRCGSRRRRIEGSSRSAADEKPDSEKMREEGQVKE